MDFFEEQTRKAAFLKSKLQREDGVCPLCADEASSFRVPASEHHHIFPQNLGGAKDSPTLFICGSCHNLIHRIGEALEAGKALEDAEVLGPLASAGFLKAPQRILGKFIAECALKAEEIRLRQAGTAEDRLRQQRQIKRLFVELPEATLNKMHLRKIDGGFHSLQAYLLALIEKDTARL